MTIYHFHHIVPRHMGGTDDSKNLIKLTVEEHAEAHRLLYEKYGFEEDRLAWLGLAGIVDKKELVNEMTKLAGKKTVIMKVGIHNPDNNLKSVGGSIAIKKMPSWTKRSKWMNNGVIDTRVCIDNINEYIEDGWKIGRLFAANTGKTGLTKNLFWVNKENKNKRIPKEEVDEYVKNGWSLGMIMHHRNSQPLGPVQASS